MSDAQHFSPPPDVAPRRIPMAEALSNNWLEIWYQPKIDLKRKCLAGAEALARINHPQDGLLWPKTFLPMLEEEELAKLAEHDLLTVLNDWTDFSAAGFDLRFAINLPTSSLRNVSIASIITERRPQAENWPGLILEVCEDQIMRDVALIQQLAPDLKAAGVTLSIDNFGAGYSSFSSLRDLPFGELKIDISFVKDCAVDPNNAAICQTAIDLAHRFGSVAVAEGVESMADLEALMAMGCDFGQGLRIAAPMSKADFLEMLRERAPTAPEQPAAETLTTEGTEGDVVA